MGRTLAEIVDVKVLTWSCVEGLMLVFFALYNTTSEDLFSALLIVAGAGVAGTMWLLLRKLRWIRSQLLDRLLFARAEVEYNQRFGKPTQSSNRSRSPGVAMGIAAIDEDVAVTLETPMLNGDGAAPLSFSSSSSP